MNYGTSVTKSYFKDGKYKEINETYTDDGIKIESIKYRSLDSDELITIYEGEKKAVIEKGEITKSFNCKEFFKGIPFMPNNIILKLGAVIHKSINVDTYEIGREYYVFKDMFETNHRWETWIDKESGLVLKTINREGNKIFFPGTEIVKEVYDNIQEYKYEFNIVKDEDVDVPDLSNYEIEYRDTGSFEDLISK